MIDGHNDLPWAMRKLCAYNLDVVDLASPVAALHTDIPRLRAGAVTGQFWSVYVPSSMRGSEAVVATMEQIDFVHSMIARYPDVFVLARCANDIEAARAEGRIASLIGIEGGHCIDESLGVLRMMFDLGARYMTLTHNDNVPWADSATDDAVIGGLSAFGEAVVREMNRMGMLVDLSHVSEAVMHDAIRVSDSPVIFSHSSARSLCDVSRNVPDEILRLLAATGGLCMVTFVPDFISPACALWFEECREMVVAQGHDRRNRDALGRILHERAIADPPPRANLGEVIAHIEHVRAIAGIDCVGLGGDFDGCSFVTRGLDDVSCYPALIDGLAAVGWSSADLAKLQFENVLRVMRRAERVAAGTTAS